MPCKGERAHPNAAQGRETSDAFGRRLCGEGLLSVGGRWWQRRHFGKHGHSSVGDGLSKASGRRHSLGLGGRRGEWVNQLLELELQRRVAGMLAHLHPERDGRGGDNGVCRVVLATLPVDFVPSLEFLRQRHLGALEGRAMA